MGTLLIDKLLSAAVKQGASDLHITIGQPPVLRIHGRLQKLKTKVLEPVDTQALMKSITPDRCQQEFQETGSADYGFAFGDACRFRVSIFRDRGNVAMALRQMPVRVPVGLRAFRALMLMLVMLVVCVQVLVLESRMLMLELLGIGGRPEPHREAARHDHQQPEHAKGPKQADLVTNHAGDEVREKPTGVRERELRGEQGRPVLLVRGATEQPAARSLHQR